jgi:hypothetical protein
MPTYDAVKSGSAATFTPTCFMAASARPPAMAAPSATSRATFSLGAHSLYTPSYSAMLSRISVLGVPG